MHLCDLAPAHIRAIAPYQPGKPISELAREMGLDEGDIVKLASNENPLGPSPRARAAIAACLDDVALYPDGNGFELKSAIVGQLAGKSGVTIAGIVLGNGSNDVLELAARALLGPGTSAVYSEHAFAVYPLATQAAGAQGIAVPARAYGHDLAAMRAAIRDDTRVVFIANPNNPTGTLLGADELHGFLASLPPSVAVVLDEAYGEYLEETLRAPSLDWLAEFPNLILTRTFSKAYGLAGLRVGYALAHPEVADLLNRVRQPFNVNSLALAGAAAALDDGEFLARSKAVNDAGMAQLLEGCKRLGLAHIPSHGNFVCVEVGVSPPRKHRFAAFSPQGAKKHLGRPGVFLENAAALVYQALLRKGVIVRPVANYGLPGFLRVSIGLPEQNARFLAALAETLEQA